MKNILVIPNPLKSQAVENAIQLIHLLIKHEFQPILEQEMAENLGFPALGRPESMLWQIVDLVMVLGGDGSMLSTARRIYPREIPLLGVNHGQVGFLTGIETHNIEDAIIALRCGNYLFEERVMLAAEVIRQQGGVARVIALNDLVVAKSSFVRIIRLETWIDGEYFTTYPGDGLIVATATGSTAYSLSAGGPILDPRLEAILMTPVCAHSLYARPVVLSKDAKIKVVIDANHDELSLTADGQEGIALQVGDTVYFERARHCTKLLRLKDQGIFETLKARLKEGRI